MELSGCYYYVVAPNPFHPRSKQYLPLINSESHTTILSTTSTTTLKQTFTNPSPTENIKECTYSFPLYDGVSVVGFTCKIGAKALTGLVKEKVEAKKIFDEAITRGETAGYLEQSPEASDVFSTKLGNIPAGESVIVKVTYIGELKHHETEGIRFTIPTSIAPRYGSGPTPTSLGPVQDGDGIKITVDVNMPQGSFIKAAQSPSHPIAVSMGTVSTATQAVPIMSKASATLSLGSAALEKDFVLIVQSKDVGVPKALLETHPTIPNHRAIMATLVPKFSLPPSRPEIVFLADRSGSMAGTSITMLVSAMKVFLKSLPSGAKFNVGSFGSYSSFIWSKSKSYTSETLNESMAHIQTFTANMGGTETFNAVRETINRRYSDLPLEIILLTDGDIWHQEELFKYVNEQVASSGGKIRIFPLGIGNGVSHALIEGLARAGNGFAQAVQSGERMDNSVVRMLRGALSPHITDYTLEVKYEQKDDDFEVIEKVTEGMKVLLVDAESEKVAKSQTKEQTSISLFDPSVDPEKEDILMTDADAELPKVPYPKLLQAPHKIPSLFAFSRTTVYLLMSTDTIQRNPTSVVLRATSAHGPLTLEIPIEVLSEPAQTIHQLAAKKAVQDLEEGRGWIFDAKDQAGTPIKDRFPSCFEDLVKREAVRLGEKFQVAGKWCSFVAVAANDKEIAAKNDQSHAHAAEDGLSFGDGDVLQDFDFDSFLAQQTASDSSIQDSTINSGIARDMGCGRDRVSDRTARSVTVHPKLANRSPQPQGASSSLFSTVPAAYAAPAAFGSSAAQTAPASALQDYQLQKMLLEQQNKRRMRMVPASPGGALPGGFGSTQPPIQQQNMFGIQQQQQQPYQAALMQPLGYAPAGGNPMSFHQAPLNNAISTPSGGLFGNTQSNTSQPSGGLFSRVRSSGSQPSGALFGTTQSNTSPSSRGLFSGPQVSNPPPPPPAQRRPAMQKSAPPPAPITPARMSGPGYGSPAQYTTHPQSFDDFSSDPEPANYFTKWANKSTAEKVLSVIELQEFGGSWTEGNGELAAILGFTIPSPPAQLGGNAKVWITLLVVAFLESKAADEEGTWSMVVEKAKEWLGEHVQSGLDGLEKAAFEVVGKN